jgi:N-acetylglucosamine kinase-like BadF-type ATPase
VTRAYYDGHLDQDAIGDLAPVVFSTAAAGDAVARSIIDHLADELALMAAALARRTGLTRSNPEVVLAGGVFKTDDSAFHAGLADRIHRSIPAARIVRLTAPPVLGAALIGLDRLNGGLRDSAVQTRLRAEIEAWSATARVVTPS